MAMRGPAGAMPLDGEELEGLLSSQLVNRSRTSRRLCSGCHGSGGRDGRHARLIADVLIEQQGAARFS